MQQAMQMTVKVERVPDVQDALARLEGGAILIPPKSGECQLCAVVHEPADPHNRDSLYYQLVFHQEHKRPPTWADAMAHCSIDVQCAWRLHLRKVGVAEEVLGVNPEQN